MLYVVPMSIMGFIQGTMLNDAAVRFLDVVQFTLPWLKLRTLAGLLLAVGHAAFVVNVGWLLVRMFEPYRKPVVRILTGEAETLAAGK